jgi:hypothetical protein
VTPCLKANHKNTAQSGAREPMRVTVREVGAVVLASCQQDTYCTRMFLNNYEEKQKNTSALCSTKPPDLQPGSMQHTYICSAAWMYAAYAAPVLPAHPSCFGSGCATFRGAHVLGPVPSAHSAVCGRVHGQDACKPILMPSAHSAVCGRVHGQDAVSPLDSV